MTAILGIILSPIGRWVSGFVAVLAIISGIYIKGRSDGKASYKAKIERQINDAIEKGETGRADALKRLETGDPLDGWFRD